MNEPDGVRTVRLACLALFVSLALPNRTMSEEEVEGPLDAVMRALDALGCPELAELPLVRVAPSALPGFQGSVPAWPSDPVHLAFVLEPNQARDS